LIALDNVIGERSVPAQKNIAIQSIGRKIGGGGEQQIDIYIPALILEHPKHNGGGISQHRAIVGCVTPEAFSVPL
jgi:hypothetical protein